MHNNKNGIILIAVLMAAVATAVFLVAEATLTLSIAYIFALIGIAMFALGNLYMLPNIHNYPWFAAFPMTIWRYLVAQLSLSAVFVIREQVGEGSLPTNWFLGAHIALLAFFAVLLILLKGSKEIIEERDLTIKDKVSRLRSLHADAEAVMRQKPTQAAELKKVVDALRFSDPMSHDSLWSYEAQIAAEIAGIAQSNDATVISESCNKLLGIIAERNAKVRLLK